MGLFDSIFGGGLYSITDKDIAKMTAKSGYVRYAFRYLGGHGSFPRYFDCVAEVCAQETLTPVMNVYINKSAAGLIVDPGQLCFTINIKKVKNLEHGNQNVLSGGVLIGHFGAILQETRYSVAIEYLDENNNGRKVAFGTTPAIKSEAYFSAFIKHLTALVEVHRPSSYEEENADMKTCPFCAEKIKEAAIVCRYCGRDLTAVPKQESALVDEPVQSSLHTLALDAEKACPVPLSDKEQFRNERITVCPKCGAKELTDDECPSCGIFISKYLAATEKKVKAPGSTTQIKCPYCDETEFFGDMCPKCGASITIYLNDKAKREKRQRLPEKNGLKWSGKKRIIVATLLCILVVFMFNLLTNKPTEPKPALTKTRKAPAHTSAQTTARKSKSTAPAGTTDSLARQLAIVDNYALNDEVAVNRFAKLLNQLDKRFPENKQQIADMTVVVQKEMAKNGVRESLLNIMADANKLPDTPDLHGMEYAQFMALYVVAREKGTY